MLRSLRELRKGGIVRGRERKAKEGVMEEREEEGWEGRRRDGKKK